MSDTTKNLKTAFAGESQANRKYLAFAKKSEEDGFPQVARLFRAAAEAETVHAHAHLRALKGVGSTKDNLREAMEGESYEFTEMYPDFIETAEKEGHKEALTSFSFANQVEQIHHFLYQAAYKAVKAGKDLPAREVYICPFCGNTVYGSPPEKCPVCGCPGKRFCLIS